MSDTSTPFPSDLQLHGAVGGERRRHVYQALKLHALRYRFKPGQHIPVVEISDRLHVSNTPVREALIRLYAEGLVVAVPSRGFFARELQLREMLELHDLARVLLQHSLKTIDAIGRMRLTGRRSDEFTLCTGAENQSLPAATLAHGAEVLFADIAHSSGNKAIVSTICNLCERTHHIRICAFQRPQCAELLRAGVGRLMDAMRSGDDDEAGDALDEHFRLIGAALPELVMHALAASFAADSNDLTTQTKSAAAF